jgi:hypothetical protein
LTRADHRLSEDACSNADAFTLQTITSVFSADFNYADQNTSLSEAGRTAHLVCCFGSHAIRAATRRKRIGHRNGTERYRLVRRQNFGLNLFERLALCLRDKDKDEDRSKHADRSVSKEGA